MGTFLLQSIQKSSGAHPASYAIGNDSSFQGAEQLRHEAHHSPPLRAKIMKERSYISTSAYTFMAYTGTNSPSHFSSEKQGARV
jgi:hypothetical protein